MMEARYEMNYHDMREDNTLVMGKMDDELM